MTVMQVESIFANLPQVSQREQFVTLLENDAVQIERIVSRSHSSPADFWYDQSGIEWVMVLRGDATLRFANGESVEMKAGDHITIPSHIKHRVDQTAPETVWLAVHLKRAGP